MILARRRAGGLPAGPARALRAHGGELTRGDRVFQVLSGIAASLPMGALAFILVVIVIYAFPAIVYNGTTFFTSTTFSFGNLYSGATVVHNGVAAPLGATYGALAFIVGTLTTSVIAIALAVPISVGGVLILSEFVPRRLQNVVSTFIELLAGIPSVVFGLWGLTVLGPFLSVHVYPALTGIGVVIPWFKGPVGSGQGLLTAAIVLAIMIVPIVASTTRELVRRVPVLAHEGALALGMTRYETVRVVTIPYVRSGIIAASLLGWGRALGETMAVLLIIGNSYVLPHNIYATTGTLAADIAGTLDGAFTDGTGMAVRGLAELGVFLLLISLLTNLSGRLLVRRISGDALPVGRGV